MTQDKHSENTFFLISTQHSKNCIGLKQKEEEPLRRKNDIMFLFYPFVIWFLNFHNQFLFHRNPNLGIVLKITGNKLKFDLNTYSCHFCQPESICQPSCWDNRDLGLNKYCALSFSQQDIRVVQSTCCTVGGWFTVWLESS